MIKSLLSENEKIVFLGIGNPLRGDDGVGCRFIRELKKKKFDRKRGIYLFNGEQLPENYLEPIVKVKPSKVFLVDAVDFGGNPGEIKLLREANPPPGFSTHTLSLSLLLEYFKKNQIGEIFIIGIQPKNIKWGDGLSKEVELTLNHLIDELLTV